MLIMSDESESDDSYIGLSGLSVYCNLDHSDSDMSD